MLWRLVRAALTTPPGTPSAPDLREQYALVYAESVRAIDSQERAVDELRARAGVVLAAASIGTSLFGGATFADGVQTAAQWAAIVLFVMSTGLAVFVLLPRATWRFHTDVTSLLRDYVESERAASMAEMHRSLAYFLDRAFEDNRSRLNRLYLLLTLSVIALIGEVVAWVVIVGRLAT